MLAEDPNGAVAAPVAPVWVPGEHAWLISRYHEVTAVLRSRDVMAANPEKHLARVMARTGRDYSNLGIVLRETPLFQECEKHRRSRTTVRGFVSVTMARWTEPVLREVATRMIAELPTDDTVEIVANIADRLPNAVLADAMGLDVDAMGPLRDRTREITGIWRVMPPLRVCDQFESKSREILSELTRLGEFGCLATGEEGDSAIGLAAFMLIAGAESISGTIAAALDILSREPRWQDALRREPTRTPSFVQEVLRLAGPLRRLNRRIASRAIMLGGVEIAAGDDMILHIERAHRDPDAFAAPATIDPSRRGPPLLAFGAGAHACQGPLLGALEVEVMLNAVLAQSALRPAGAGGCLFPQPDLRQFAALPLHLFPARSA